MPKIWFPIYMKKMILDRKMFECVVENNDKLPNSIIK